MTAPPARHRVPLAEVQCRIAAEQEALARLAQELEAMLGASPALARALDGPGRASLQRLDYLRQALEGLAGLTRALAQTVPDSSPPESRPPDSPPVDIRALTAGLALRDIAARLCGDTAPTPSAEEGEPQFFT